MWWQRRKGRDFERDEPGPELPGTVDGHDCDMKAVPIECRAFARAAIVARTVAGEAEADNVGRLRAARVDGRREHPDGQSTKRE